MTDNGHNTVRLEFCSVFDMLDFVQIVGDYMARSAGLDEDSLHWVSVAIRESVINAIKHGNRHDPSKHVFVEFATDPGREISVRIRDQGEGFDPEEVADPLSPENMLKSSGRGIFLMRAFMDHLSLQRAPQGGMEVHMIKRSAPPSTDT
jgi:serine/threonine-protein kinase RsbW